MVVNPTSKQTAQSSNSACRKCRFSAVCFGNNDNFEVRQCGSCKKKFGVVQTSEQTADEEVDSILPWSGSGLTRKLFAVSPINETFVLLNSACPHELAPYIENDFWSCKACYGDLKTPLASLFPDATPGKKEP